MAETIPLSSQHLCGQSMGLLTNSLHHACLSGVCLHGNHVLEAVQRDDAQLGCPHLKDVLHFGAQFLPHRIKRSSYYRFYLVHRADQCHQADLGHFVPSVVL